MTGDVFIVGAPRSGTSWVQSVLGNHPSFAAPPETNLFLALREVEFHRDGTGPTSGLQHCVTDEQLTEWYAALWSTVRDNLFGVALGATRIVEKTPAHVGSIDLIRRVVPGARFVNVVRDPRDVARSLLEAAASWGSDWAPSNVEKAIDIWRDAVTSARAVDPSDDVLTVRYEDLVAGRDSWELLLTHVGVDPDWELVGLDDPPHTRLDRISTTPTDSWTEQEGFSFHSRSSAQRRELTAFERRLVEIRCGGLMTALGYAVPAGRSLSRVDRVRAQSRRARRAVDMLWSHRALSD